MVNLITPKRLQLIKDVCAYHDIKNYTINPDESINVSGSVLISNKTIPLMFNKVSDDFICNSNGLESLSWCPKEVGGDFDCSHNNLTSIEYAPSIVCESFRAIKNKLSSFYGIPGNLEIDYFFNYDLFPDIVYKKIRSFTKRERTVFFKYLTYFDVWTPEFNEQAFFIFLDEINDGLL